MNEETPMTYWQCVIRILWHPWFDFIENDAICGNGFQIAGYGMWLILKYVFFLIIQVILFVTFPISGALLWHYDKKGIKRRKEAHDRAMADL